MLRWLRTTGLKLLMVSLAYAFLLGLLLPECKTLRERLLPLFCHRTGKRSREISAPLYRLRSALSRLWLLYLTPFIPAPQNSG